MSGIQPVSGCEENAGEKRHIPTLVTWGGGCCKSRDHLTVIAAGWVSYRASRPDGNSHKYWLRLTHLHSTDLPSCFSFRGLEDASLSRQEQFDPVSSNLSLRDILLVYTVVPMNYGESQIYCVPHEHLCTSWICEMISPVICSSILRMGSCRVIQMLRTEQYFFLLHRLLPHESLSNVRILTGGGTQHSYMFSVE